MTPNLVDPSRSAELFATFADNPVVVCFVVALIVVYLLVLVWARRKDNQDTAKVESTLFIYGIESSVKFFNIRNKFKLSLFVLKSSPVVPGL